MAQGVLRYIIEFFKKSEAAGEAKKEIADIGKEGEKQSKTLAESFNSAFKDLRAGVTTFTRMIGTLAGAWGLVVGAISLVMAAWKNYKASLEDVIKSTRDSYNAHSDLIVKFEAAEKAGVKLTDSQREYLAVLKEVASVEAERLTRALEERRAELEKMIPRQAQVIAQLQEHADQVGNQNIPKLQAARKALEDYRLELAAIVPRLEGLAKGDQGMAGQLEDQTRKAEEEGKAKLAALQAGLSSEMDAVRMHTQERLALEGGDVADRIAIIEEGTAREHALLVQANDNGLLTDAQFGLQEAALARRTAKAVSDEVLRGKLDERAKRTAMARAMINIEEALGARLVQMAFDAGEKGKANSRDFAKEMVRITAQTASMEILAFGADAATKAAAAAAVGGPIAAAAAFAATYAPYVALSASVAALGGVASRAIGGGPSGGSEPSYPDVGEPGGPGGTGGQPLNVNAVPTAETKPAVNVYISTLGEIPPTSLREIEERIAEAASR